MSAPVIYKTADAEHTLPKLCPKDIVTIGEKVYIRARERLIADLDSAGAEPVLRLKELKELETKRGVGSVLVRHGFTVEGAIEIIERSIEISGKDIDIDFLQLDPTDGMFRLALKLIGVNWDKVTSDKKDDKDDLDSDPTKKSPETG